MQFIHTPSRNRGARSGRAAGLIAIAVTASALHSAGAADDAPPARAAHTLTLAEAIDAALSHNPELAIATQTIAAANARTSADASLRLPVLNLRASALWWDHAIVADLGADIGKITIRDRLTGSVDLSVTQPVSGALVIGRLVSRDRAVADASRAQRDGLRIDVAYRTAEAYLDALQAATLGRLAEASLRQLDADLQHAQRLLQAGTLQRVDVLRLEVEHARVEQQRLEADAGAIGARRRLALLLGLPDGSELGLVDIDTTPPPLAWTEDEAVQHARRDRADARVVDANRRAAELNVDLSRASYLPNVSVVGVYSHAVSTAVFGSAAQSEYLGVTLDWNLWDWGKRSAEVDVARAASQQAQLAQHALTDQIAVDTRARWQAARTAQATLEVAARGLVAATETQRLEAARFAQGAATTVEVVDAETALTSAQAQAAISRYRYLVAWMALSREVGALPTLARPQ
jgi:outer membrane protein TolC